MEVPGYCYPLHHAQESAVIALLGPDHDCHGSAWSSTSNLSPAVSCHCYSLQGMPEDSSRDLVGWEGKAVVPSASAHCVLDSHTPTSDSAYTASATILQPKGSGVAGQHKTVYGRGSCGHIGRSDSRTSLKGYMYLFEPPPILYEFEHCDAGVCEEQRQLKDLATFYVEAYKRQHTYPNLQQRVSSTSADGSAQLNLYCSCASMGAGSSHHISPALKPKLLVLGQGKSSCSKHWKKPHSFRRVVPVQPLMDAFHKKDYEAPTHSTSPSTPPTLEDRTSVRGHTTRAAFVQGEHRSQAEKSTSPVMSIKWASQTFPSFVVSSAKKPIPDILKSKTSSPKVIGSNRQLSQAFRSRPISSKTSLPFNDLGGRNMPLISPSGLATKSEFSHLLRHQTQVSFHGNTRPGFRYETLCLQGHNTDNIDSSSVVGPWITSH